MAFDVQVHTAVEAWLEELDRTDRSKADAVIARIELLAQVGPALGRPAVDRIASSEHPNMKELRLSSIRILFAFDPDRRAVLLVAGDKAGDWDGWYRECVPLADARFDEHLEGLDKGAKT